MALPSEVADHAREFEFHPEQKLETQPDGSLVVRFMVYGVDYASDPQNISKVYDGIVQELSRLQTEPISPEEIQRAKALLCVKFLWMNRAPETSRAACLRETPMIYPSMNQPVLPSNILNSRPRMCSWRSRSGFGPMTSSR
jgi:hypothetical protein